MSAYLIAKKQVLYRLRLNELNEYYIQILLMYKIVEILLRRNSIRIILFRLSYTGSLFLVLK